MLLQISNHVVIMCYTHWLYLLRAAESSALYFFKSLSILSLQLLPFSSTAFPFVNENIGFRRLAMLS
jgi:hypothetical protein